VTRVRGAALPRVVAVFALAAAAPLLFSAGGDVLNNMVLAAVYVVMALGLNYTAAYFGSGFWANAGSDWSRSRSSRPST
jgi:hypothetical protein